MLTKIECDKFIENDKPRGPISFHEGINAIFGDGKKNSLGKSTFLLVIDFCFGGNDYINIEKETIKIIGDHTIYFDFLDHGKTRYFSRKTNDKGAFVSEYSDSTHTIEIHTYDLKTYTKELLKIYDLESLNLSMRAIVSKFFRIYNRTTINELRPLNTTLNEDEQKTIVNLLKLYEVNTSLEDLLKERDVIKEKYDYYQGMKKHASENIVTTKENYETNLKEIEKLQEAIRNTKIDSENGSADSQYIISLRKNELLIQVKTLKKQIARLNYSKNTIVAKDIDEVSTVKTIDKLKVFFPNETFEPIYKIEEFHRNIRSVLVDEANEQNKKIDATISAIQEKIDSINKELQQYEKTPIITEQILDQFHRDNDRMKTLIEANKNYLEFTKTSKEKDDIEEKIKNNSQSDIKLVTDKINKEMARLESTYSADNYYPPELYIKNLDSYSFGILRDTGTANRYKAVITFDTTIINQTKLPCFIHDSVFFNSLGNDNMSYVINLYKTIKNKQIFLAFDDAKKINNAAEREYLLKRSVLSLSEGNGALFGKEFNKKDLPRG